jgi:hypothetical protein
MIATLNYINYADCPALTEFSIEKKEESELINRYQAKKLRGH